MYNTTMINNARPKGWSIELLERLRHLGIRFTLRHTIVTACAIFAVLFFISLSPVASPGFRIGGKTPLEAQRQAQVEEAFQHAWDGYSEHCFGHDILHPVSNTCGDEFGGWGATAIDALSSAILMGKEAVVIQILEFIETLDFDVVRGGSSKVQVFEVVIRHLGGMVSAWDLLNGPFSHMAKDTKLRQALYNQMFTLGNRLSCAFDTPSGIPHDWLDPASCKGGTGTKNTVAGAGSIILEFARLSEITGNQTYRLLAERAEEYLLKPEPADHEPFPGLVGSYVDLDNGEMVNDKGSWGAFADSFYEYLLKAYIYNSNAYSECLGRWLLAADSTIRSIGSHPYGHPEWTLLPSWSGTALTYRMESLSWFAGGNFILGGMITKNQTLVDFGLSIADTAGAVYNMTTTGLGGEFVAWYPDCDDVNGTGCNREDSLRIHDTRFKLRPEVIETWYYAYRATRDPKYQDWAWSAFEAINLHCRTDSGFSGISNVNAEDGGRKSDVQESFVLAEVLKYIYLIHLEDRDTPFHVQDSRSGGRNTWVFNTEAHPLRVSGPPK